MNRFYNQTGKKSLDRFRHSASSLFSFQSAYLTWYKKHFVFPAFHCPLNKWKRREPSKSPPWLRKFSFVQKEKGCTRSRVLPRKLMQGQSWSNKVLCKKLACETSATVCIRCQILIWSNLICRFLPSDKVILSGMRGQFHVRIWPKNGLNKKVIF